MLENIAIEQTYLFLIYIITGILIGILFDIFRVLRKSFKTTDMITYIEDILFWIITGIIIIFVLFKFGSGELRIYSIIGILVGTLLYMIVGSNIFIKVNVKIIKFMKKVISFPIKIMSSIIKKVFSPFTFLVINIKKVTINFIKNVKNDKKISK